MIDNIIIFFYLFSVVLIGIWCGKKTVTFKDFAVSDMSFGTFAIFATLSASFIGGGFSLGNAAKVFNTGIYNSVVLIGFSLQIILVSLFIAPKMKHHLNAISVGDIIEPSYGRAARVVCGVLCFISCSGILGAQLGAMGVIIEVLTGIPALYGNLIGCGIILTYSTIGGIKAVVWTDIVQFCLLVVATPLLFILGVGECGGWQTFISQVPPSHFELLPSSLSVTALISLFLVFFIGETLVPPYVQRLLLTKERSSLIKGTFFSGILSVPFFLISGGIGLVALVLAPDIDSNNVFPEMINLLLPVGLRGVVIASVIAIVMSSADSFLHSSSIAIVQDVYAPLTPDRLHRDEVKMKLARTVNLFSGILAMFFAIMIPNLIDILVFAYNFWAPMILVQLIAALLKRPVYPPSFFYGLTAGLLGAVTWNCFFAETIPVNGLIIGTLCNFIVFMCVNKLKKSN